MDRLNEREKGERKRARHSSSHQHFYSLTFVNETMHTTHKIKSPLLPTTISSITLASIALIIIIQLVYVILRWEMQENHYNIGGNHCDRCYHSYFVLPFGNVLKKESNHDHQ